MRTVNVLIRKGILFPLLFIFALIGANSAHAQQSFAAERMPTFGTTQVGEQIWPQDTEVRLSLPSARSTVVAEDRTLPRRDSFAIRRDYSRSLSYSFSPSLPQGVTFDRSEFRITGTPTTALPRTQFTMTATDSDGDTGTLTFYITVSPRGITISETFLRIEEGGSSTYTVVLNTRPPADNVIILPHSSEIVTFSPTFLGFTSANWNTPQTVTVTAAEDDDNQDESVSVTHEVRNYISQAPSIAVSVDDDEPVPDPGSSVPPGVTISTESLTVDEGSAGTYTVVLDTQPRRGLTVRILPRSDNRDVTFSTPVLIFTPANWDVPQTVIVRGAEDGDALDDRATVRHSVSGYDSVTSAPDVAVRVNDNEDGVRVIVSLPGLTIDENTAGTYTVSLNTQPDGPVTIMPTSSNGDVTVNPPTLTFTTGNWNVPQRVTVRGAEDDDGADDRATVSHPVDRYRSVNRGPDVAVTVRDNDAGVTVSRQTLTVDEGSTGTYTVVLDAEPGGNVTVTPSSGNTDVSVNPSTLTFTTGNWSTARTITVSAAEDDDGVNERVTVRHSVSGYDSVTSGPDVAVTVTENDEGLRVSLSELTIDENTVKTYTVSLNTQPSTGVVRVVRVVLASDDSDVTVSPTTLSFRFGNWNTPQTVTVSGADDADGADDSATVSHIVSGYGELPSVAVTVTDDDTDGVTVSQSALELNEGATGTYTVVLDTQPLGDVRIRVRRNNGDVSVNPSALDFTTVNWNLPQTVTVSAAEDDGSADDSATVGHTVSGYGAVTAPSVSVTVTDDDTDRVRVSQSELTIMEGETGTYTVVLGTRPSGSVLITSSSDNTDVTVNPSELIFTTGNWDVAQTVTVSAAEDDGGEDDSATVSHEVTGYGVVTAPSVSVTVTDNDMDGVTVSESSLTITEGETGTYTVVLGTLPGGDVTVTPQSSDTSAATVNPSELTFTTANWNVAQTVTVSAAEDDDGADDTATVSHTVTGYGSVTSADTVSVTVTDDDEPELVISAPRVTVTRGGPPATYTVRLRIMPSGDVTVTPSSSNNGVTANPSPLTFTTGNWNTAQTVTVSVAEDADVPNGDNYEVSHMVTGYPGYNPDADVNSIGVTVIDGKAKAVMEKSLAVLGRTVATSAVETISERFSASGSAPGSRMRGVFNGRRMTLSDFRKAAGAVSDGLSSPAGRTSLSVESAVSETDAEVTIAGGGENEDALTLWIKGDFRKSEGEFSIIDNPNLSVDGETYSSYLGLDYRFGEKALLGFALSASRSEVKHSGSEDRGKLEATLASVYPYVHWKPHEGLELWALAGAGKGEGELQRDGEDTIEDIGIGTRMFAGGARQGLLSWHWFDFALKTDAYAIWVDSDSDLELDLESADASVQRVRLALDARSKDLLGSANHNFASGVEIGGRLDGGDGGSGLGADVGVSLGYAYIPGNVSVDARGRFLVFHEESGFKDWGAGLTARVGSGANDRGLSLSVSSDWGGQSSGGVAKLWESGESLSSGEAELDMVPSNVTGELGYGLSLRGSDMFVPFAKLGLDSSRERSVGMGARWELAGGVLDGLGLELLGEQKENENGFADYRIGITGAIRF